MPKIKISVIKRFSPEDVFGHEYKTPVGKVIEKCHFEDGQEWISEDGEMPEGFCGWAWTDLARSIHVLRFGGNFKFWAEDGIMYDTCSDGVRPVCFKLERIEE
ncbi:MAG: TIGR04076 family protein [Candidatus Thorarchaeota archaeon]